MLKNVDAVFLDAIHEMGKFIYKFTLTMILAEYMNWFAISVSASTGTNWH